LVPALVYNVETFERLLLQLGRQLGDRSSFLRAMKRSTARDFKIDVRRLAKDEGDDADDDQESRGADRPRGRGKKRRSE